MKISWLKERLWRGCLLEVRHRFFQSEPDWFWSDVEDDGGGWRQRQRKLRLIGCQRLLNSHLVSLPLPVFPLWIHISKRFISDKTKNLNEIQLARRWKTLSSRGSVRSSDSILFGQANLDVLSYSEPLTHQHGFSLFISGFVDATIVYGKQNKCVVAVNLEARKAKRNKFLLESYWKNQATHLPWATATMKNCFSAMVEGFVLQGSGDKEEGVKWSLCFDYFPFDFYSSFGIPWSLQSDKCGRKS
ncbi:hypothetical protein V6N12_066570 [Hibiscus sabdariffa]|uniref:Uncharacterized protein n=1 Tax=Hibiscus sabdariffa TaxID=183260 RepID=A0ABR2CQJ8_9ROSI